MGTGRTLLAAGLGAAGVVLVVAAQPWQSSGQPAARPDAPPVSPSATGAVGGARTSAASGTHVAPEPARAPAEPGAPRRLEIPTLGVSAPVVPVRAVDDTLVPPSDPGRLGWWADGARPGERRGSALVAGHTVHTGGGALERLAQVTRGSQVLVRTDRSRVVYEVQRVRTYGKGRINRDAERLFSQEVPGRLVLVTCADWDGTQFLSNVVVIATPVAAPVT